MGQLTPPLEYLLDCSRESLRDFRLARLNASANTRRDLRELLDRWIEEAVLALLAEWFETHGEELIIRAAESPSLPERTARNEKPQPLTRRPFEFWRAGVRNRTANGNR